MPYPKNKPDAIFWPGNRLLLFKERPHPNIGYKSVKYRLNKGTLKTTLAIEPSNEIDTPASSTPQHSTNKDTFGKKM